MTTARVVTTIYDEIGLQSRRMMKLVIASILLKGGANVLRVVLYHVSITPQYILLHDYQRNILSCLEGW